MDNQNIEKEYLTSIYPNGIPKFCHLDPDCEWNGTEWIDINHSVKKSIERLTSLYPYGPPIFDNGCEWNGTAWICIDPTLEKERERLSYLYPQGISKYDYLNPDFKWDGKVWLSCKLKSISYYELISAYLCAG